MDSKYAEQTIATKSAPGSYFGFQKMDSATKVQDAFQIAPKWSNCKLRGEFDTLQVIDDIYVPKTYGNTGTEFEPFTKCYPEYGKGGAYQLKVDKLLNFNNVKMIGD